MGMFDHVVVLDEPLTCPAGHPVAGLQTKSFPDPSMSTYLVQRGRLVRADTRWSRGDADADADEDEREAWRIDGDEAVRETHYRLEPVTPPGDLRVYSHCEVCEPVLTRTDRVSLWGDVVGEHRLFVEYALTFPEHQPMAAERVTGDREALKDELRHNGLRVLEDDEALAVAHREIRRARQESRRR